MSAVMTQEKQGYIAAMLAYIWWGLVPIYFKALSHVDAMEILMHRIAWCVPMLVLPRRLLPKSPLREPK